MLAMSITLLFATLVCAGLLVASLSVRRGWRLLHYYRAELAMLDHADAACRTGQRQLRPARQVSGFSPALLNSAGWTHRTARRTASVRRAAA